MSVSISDTLARESGRIGPDVLKRSLPTQVWASLVPQDVWPDGMGWTISTLSVERAGRSSAEPTWDALTSAITDGDTTSGNPTVTTITTGTTTTTYNLAHAAVESSKIDLENIRTSFQAREVLGKIMEQYQDQIADIWSERRRSEYVRISANKVVLNAAFTSETTSGNSMPTSGGPATKYLSQGYLEDWYQQLAVLGVGNYVPSGVNGPELTVVIDPAVSRDLIRRNPEIRQDFRDAVPAEHLKSLGITSRSYAGFTHKIDPFAPRYNFDTATNTWTRVFPFTFTGGGAASSNYAAWKAATHVDTIIQVPAVYSELVPKLMNTPGGNTQFGVQGYRGDFKFMNYQTDANKDLRWGFFRGLLMAGSKPRYPEFGVVIRHLRPQDTADLTGPA